MEDLLKGLNDKQYEAVVNTEGPCLVIAAAAVVMVTPFKRTYASTPPGLL